MSISDYLPHKGVTFSPFPEEPPEGWPYEYVARVDFDALAARFAEAERLLREVYREEFDDRGMTPRVCAIALWFGTADSADATPAPG